MDRNEIEDSPIKCMFWKDEILQLLYWMKGEKLGEELSLQQLLPLLNTNEKNLEFHLNLLHQRDFLELRKIDGVTKYKLAPTGSIEGSQLFAEAFKGMQKAGHGECGPDCEFCYGPDGSKLDNCVHNCAS